jgi:hypothetical protein
MQKVDEEVAKQEVESWLDHKKVGPKKREINQGSIDTMVEAICEGYLELKDDKKFVQKLKFPTTGEISIEELTFAARINMVAVSPKMEGVKNGDVDGRLMAYISALTTKPKDLIKRLDSEDLSLAQSIAIFFL